MAAGALALAVTAVFATKANKKFNLLQTGFSKVNSGFSIKWPTQTLTVYATGLNAAIVTISTSNATNHLIFRTQLCTSGTNHHLLFY